MLIRIYCDGSKLICKLTLRYYYFSILVSRLLQPILALPFFFYFSLQCFFIRVIAFDEKIARGICSSSSSSSPPPACTVQSKSYLVPSARACILVVCEYVKSDRYALSGEFGNSYMVIHNISRSTYGYIDMSQCRTSGQRFKRHGITSGRSGNGTHERSK